MPITPLELANYDDVEFVKRCVDIIDGNVTEPVEFDTGDRVFPSKVLTKKKQ